MDIASSAPRAPWPHLRSYEGDALRRVSMPVGGIGTGTIGLGGRGQLTDWEVRNKPAKGARPEWGFLALACRSPSGSVARVLEGELGDEDYDGALGAPSPVAGLPRFRRCRFDAAYPLGVVTLEDEAVPVRVVTSTFNPLVPGDETTSGYPALVMRVRLENLTAEALDVRLLLSFQLPPNPLQSAQVGGAQMGRDASLGRQPDGPAPRVDVTAFSGPEGAGVQLGDVLSSDERDHGTMAAALSGATKTFTCAPVEPEQWNTGIIDLWRRLEGWGSFEPAGESSVECSAEATVPLVAEARVEPLGTAEVTVLVTWHYPNRRAWAFSGPGARGGDRPEVVGNEYTSRFRDARQALQELHPRLTDLEQRTTRFVEAVVRSSLPQEVLEAALFNLSTLRSQTVFRTADGTPYGWEGCMDDEGSCPGSCTHVWNYDLATPFLYPSLAQAMRRVELAEGMMDSGALSFRVLQPREHSTDWGLAAADGQFGCIVKLHREWRMSGDDALLKELWPSARKALEFAWLPGSWDPDADGVAEGCQHYSMDVELYGPNPVVQGWYIAALRACAAMGRAMGEEPFAERCTELAASGSAWTEANLFNGEYYVQQIRPPETFEGMLPEVRHATMGATSLEEPEYQIGIGCQVDQLVGHVASIFAGLGEVFESSHVGRSLASIQAYNFVPQARDKASMFRTFMLGDEGGYVTVAYPHGGEPPAPMPYTSQVMSGFEYTFGIAAALSGRPAVAEHVARTVRRRHDGRHRNPFNEAECGDHYARALASWGMIPALTGFAYDAHDAEMTIARSAGDVEWVWCVAGAWGVVRQRAVAGEHVVTLEVAEGSIDVRRLVVRGGERGDQDGGGRLETGDRVVVRCRP